MRDRKIAAAPLLLVSCLLLFLVVFTELALGQLSSGAERVALLQLRSSLGIRSKEWPRKADPCSDWNGISCSTNGRVTGINISGFRRTRVGAQNPQFSVDSLANLTFLQSFNASNFLLPGQIPNLFGLSLFLLQLLDLTSCSVTGPIPSSLVNLTNLTILALASNNLTGQIPSNLGRLSNLSVLDLSRNSLSGPIPSSFVSLANLSTLDISSNSFSGSVPFQIGTILALKSLNLSSNNFSGSVPAELGNLSNLVELDLSFNEFSGLLPSDLRGLTSLQTLVLRNNRFNASFPEEVWSIPGLTFLDLSGNNFTGLLPDISFSSNGPAASLNLSRNSFYGNLTQLLRKFSDIDLSGNYFEGKVPNFTPSNATLSDNCLQDVFNQRSIDECQLFYAQKGLEFDNFGRPNTAPAPTEPRKKNAKRLYILIGILGGLGLLTLLSVCCLLFFICRRGRGPTNRQETNVGSVPSGGARPVGEPTNIARVGDSFTYQQLLQSTNEFSDSNLIKHGHSGDLFKGFLEGGTPIVVKKVDLRTVKKETYPVELDFFGKVSHGRFVPFLGHYLEDEHQKFLVYKYMPNEDLASSFYSKGNSDDDSLQALDWIKRLKIAVGAAEGLSYLHHECNPPLVHRDVQASSILLDDKFEVRLGSLSEVCAQEGDTHQSRITRLLRLPQSSSSEQTTSDSATANCAYDVYCFGKVLLELVTGKLGLSESPDSDIKEYIDQTLPYINIYDKELVTKIVDPLLIVDEDLLEEVWAMAIVARSCLNPKPSRRPPMRYILKALENPLKIVREENTDSGRLRTTSSRASWNVALFGSWRQSSDVAVVPGSLAAIRAEGGGSSSLKQSGTTGSQSNGSGPNGSSSHRRHSNEIFPEPEPASSQDVDRFHE